MANLLNLSSQLAVRPTRVIPRPSLRRIEARACRLHWLLATASLQSRLSLFSSPQAWRVHGMAGLSPSLDLIV